MSVLSRGLTIKFGAEAAGTHGRTIAPQVAKAFSPYIQSMNAPVAKIEAGMHANVDAPALDQPA